MKNWAGNLKFHPAKVLYPSSTESAQALVKEHLNAHESIRVRGSAHSWMPLIETNESLMHLDKMQGIVEFDAHNHLIKAKAGTKLALFSKAAFKHKLSLPNQGDIDSQSIAGALSTGTHGTGIDLQSMSNQIQSLTLITGTAEIVHIDADKNPDLLKAVAVSFGSVGLITEVTLKMIPAYKLKVEICTEDMQTSIKQLSLRLKENRHLEMFYFPVGDWSIVKKMNMTDENVSRFLRIQKFGELVIDNWLYECLHIIAHKKKNTYHSLDSLARKFVGEKSYVNWAHKAFPSPRTIRFMEMEYSVAIEKFEEVFEEMRAAICTHNFKTLFPIEIRFVKGDELWLSPAYKRDSVYFAVHSYIKEDFRGYFNEMERIFKRHGGRPHWGKWHTMGYDDFEKIYPKWHDFLKVRSEFDPQGVWLNGYLKNQIRNLL